jgi:flagellin
MSIVVNTNTSSINAQRSLNVVNRSLDKALERLASGLRINHAGDDAAGLAIADGLQAQTRGLTQAVRNASDGLSVVGTAEGALTTQTSILQRIRELAVQAANDINSGTNRAAIQAEITAQVSELTRLGNTTEFNGQSLLNGSFSNKLFQVGAYSGQSISISLGDFRASAMGTIAQTTSAQQITVTVNASAAGITTTQGTVASLAASVSDGVSTVNADGSAIAKAASVNASYGVTGVSASVVATSTVGTTAVTGGTAGGSTAITINNVTISLANLAVVGADTTGTLRAAINAKSNETGVVASLNATNFVVLTAADGRNLTYQVTGSSAGIAAAVGWNTMALPATVGGGVKLTSDMAFSLTGTTTALGFAAPTTIALDPNKAVNKIDVSTQTGADTAIAIVDSALRQVGTAEGTLGALTNRLENTISNLQVSIENLSASESRIRDADFAAETAALTRAQIIQQASVAVLSQANLRPQAALSLIGQ